jgi:hypothetical protein
VLVKVAFLVNIESPSNLHVLPLFLKLKFVQGMKTLIFLKTLLLEMFLSLKYNFRNFLKIFLNIFKLFTPCIIKQASSLCLNTPILLD